MHKVLLALDGSAESDEAARWVAEMVAPGDTEVVAAAVLTPRMLFRFTDMDIDEPVQSLVDRKWTAPLRVAGIFCRTIVRNGDAAAELAALTEEEQPDWVVVGSHGKAGLSGLGIGDVTRALAHRLQTPFIVVRGSHRPLRSGAIVVGVDGSPGSANALRWAMHTAADFDADVTALFAYDPMADSYPHSPVDNWHYIGEDDTRRQVAEISDEAGLPIELKIVGSEPGEALDKEATTENAGLVVVSRRSRHSMHGTMLGRVPVHVLAHGSCPVAIIPSEPTRPWWSGVRAAIRNIA